MILLKNKARDTPRAVRPLGFSAAAIAIGQFQLMSAAALQQIGLVRLQGSSPKRRWPASRRQLVINMVLATIRPATRPVATATYRDPLHAINRPLDDRDATLCRPSAEQLKGIPSSPKGVAWRRAASADDFEVMVSAPDRQGRAMADCDRAQPGGSGTMTQVSLESAKDKDRERRHCRDRARPGIPDLTTRPSHRPPRSAPRGGLKKP